MGKLKADIEYLADFDINQGLRIDIKQDTLASEVNFLSGLCSSVYVLNDDLPNLKSRIIAQKLASALDKNSVEEIKSIKTEFANSKEFATAKNYLNQKCKEVWSVYEDKNAVPKEALKALGITNKPEVDVIFSNTLKYFENDNSSTTVQIIERTLNNKNLSYSMDEIHKYFEKMALKENCRLNFKTVKYLIEKQNYDKNKLESLRISDDTLKQAISELGLKVKVKFLFTQLVNNLKIRMKNALNFA